MTKSMALESILGLMDGNTRAPGSKESNMEMGDTSSLVDKKD